MLDVLTIALGVVAVAIVAIPLSRLIRRLGETKPLVVIPRKWLGRWFRLFFYIYSGLFGALGFAVLALRLDLGWNPIQGGLVLLGMSILFAGLAASTHLMGIRADEVGIYLLGASVDWENVSELRFRHGLGLRLRTEIELPWWMQRWSGNPDTYEFSEASYRFEPESVEVLLRLFDEGNAGRAPTASTA